MALCATPSWAYNFSAVAPSGQTLYYNIVNGNVQVTSQYSSPPYYSTYPTGSLVIPNSIVYGGVSYTVTSINISAFFSCSGLTSVTIPNSVTSIGVAAFQNCSGLTSVTIPNSVTSIGNYAFGYCRGLTSVTIPNSVTSIGESAFAHCSGLTSVTIGNSVTSIGNSAFSGCSGLTSVNYTGTIAQWCSINFSGFSSNPTYYSHTLSINGSPLTNLVIPEGVTEIKQYAFYYCRGLTSVTIPNSVTSIGNEAFYNCSGLTSVSIGNSVISIGNKAFYNCSSLTSVTIPNSVTSIGSSAFSGCSGLTSVTIPNSVTSIGSSAFSGCRGLTSVTIPSSVTSIGSSAFSDVRHIEYYGSASGSPWGAISMNGIMEGDFVYSDSTKHYLAAYLGIGGSVTVPSSVDTIGNKAFSGCSGLTSVTIGNSVTSIGNEAFRNCSGLTSVTIGNSVTSVGNYAFSGCSGLTSVTIPSSVTSIGNYAFSGCSGLTEINTFATAAPTFGSAAFSGVTSTIPINIPCGSIESYQYWWNYFSNFIEQAPNISIASADSATGFANFLTEPSSCNSTMDIIATAKYGYHFDHWSDGSTDNPHTVIATQDMTLTAYFNPNQYTLNVMSANVTMGNVSGNGNCDYLSNRTITATPNYGYHFDHWSNGSTENPDTITLIGDSTIVAYFERNEYTLLFQSADTTKGIVNVVSITGLYLDTTPSIMATALPHYHFVHWNDNNTENPRRFVIDDNRTYTAYFAIDVHNVNVQVDNIAHGTVDGSGSREYGQPITVSATPYSGYQFTHWSNGSTYNPYTFAVLQDSSLTAFFVADGEPWQDTVVLYDTINVDVHDTTYIDVHDTTYIPYAVHDTTYIDVHDTTYIDVPYAVHDTTYIDVPYPVHDTTVITDTVTMTEYVPVHDTTYIDIHDTTYINVSVHDTTFVTDTMIVTQFDTMTVTDTMWLTQTDTLWLHDTIIIHDTVYITQEGIDGADALNAKVYSSRGQIVVEGADGNPVALYDVNGRMLATKQDYGTAIRFDIPASSTYMIKIGNHTARKVVVVR